MEITAAAVLISSCNIIKTIHLLKKGNTTPDHFKEEIPFEMRAGIIFIKAAIEGKEYTFIFDSGATNAVSAELGDKLKLKHIAHQKAIDFEGKSGRIDFAVLKNISIGKINFENTGCAIIDFKTVAPEVKCLHVDGLIGANLMQKAVWQIDYKNKKIIFADNIDSLHVLKETPSVSFMPLLSGTPTFKAEINGVPTHRNIFDTGSSGGILFVKKDMDKLNAAERTKPVKTFRGVGSKGSGLYGRKIDTTYLSLLQNIKAGTFEIKNAKAEFKKTNFGNCGSGFMKNYIVTFDWKNKKAWFMQNADLKTSERVSFGFSPAVKDRKMFVSYVYDNSPAQLSGIKLNDQIISADGEDYRTVSDDTYCNMVRNLFLWKNSDTLNLTIRSAEGEKSVRLIANDFFNH